MRCVWVLAIACLMAAAGVRPLAIERREQRASRIEAAPATIVVLARRAGASQPDPRLAPAVLVAAPAVTPPARVAIPDRAELARRLAGCGVDTPCARSPPNARAC
jgi:hypothetical protein